MAGDVSQDNLGLSAQDRATLLREVCVVFHCAATINFNAALSSAVNINVLGVRRVLQLCKQMTSLRVRRGLVGGRGAGQRSADIACRTGNMLASL